MTTAVDNAVDLPSIAGEPREAPAVATADCTSAADSVSVGLFVGWLVGLSVCLLVRLTSILLVQNNVLVRVDPDLEAPLVDYVKTIPLRPLLNHPLSSLHLRLPHRVHQHLSTFSHKRVDYDLDQTHDLQ